MISRISSTIFMVIILLFAGTGITLATPATTTEEPSPSEETTAPEEPEPEPETPPIEPEPEPTPVEPEPEQTPAEENAEAAITSQDDTIHPCLLDPSDPVCPKPGPDQDCPEGYAQNEDGNCFLLHPEGCPQGYHGHEDDETGRCIPNSTPCDPSYILTTGENGRKNCERKEFYCQTHQNDNRCRDDNDNGKDDDHDRKVIIIKKFIKDTDIINKINDADSNGDLDISQTIVAINYNEGAGINCVFDDDDNGQCETFDVNRDSGKEPLLQIVPFDNND